MYELVISIGPDAKRRYEQMKKLTNKDDLDLFKAALSLYDEFVSAGCEGKKMAVVDENGKVEYYVSV